MKNLMHFHTTMTSIRVPMDRIVELDGRYYDAAILAKWMMEQKGDDVLVFAKDGRERTFTQAQKKEVLQTLDNYNKSNKKRKR